MTWNGIPKPWYFSYLFLSRIQGCVMSRGEAHLAVRGKDRLHIITYNLGGYSPLILKSIRNRKELIAIIDSSASTSMHKFVIRGLHGRFKMIRQRLNRDTCLFSNWNDLGSPDYLNEEEEKIFANLCFPKAEMKVIDIEDKVDLVSTNEPFGVERILLEAL